MAMEDSVQEYLAKRVKRHKLSEHSDSDTNKWRESETILDDDDDNLKKTQTKSDFAILPTSTSIQLDNSHKTIQEEVFKEYIIELDELLQVEETLQTLASNLITAGLISPQSRSTSSLLINDIQSLLHHSPYYFTTVLDEMRKIDPIQGIVMKMERFFMQYVNHILTIPPPVPSTEQQHVLSKIVVKDNQQLMTFLREPGGDTMKKFDDLKLKFDLLLLQTHSSIQNVPVDLLKFHICSLLSESKELSDAYYKEIASPHHSIGTSTLDFFQRNGFLNVWNYEVLSYIISQLLKNDKSLMESLEDYHLKFIAFFEENLEELQRVFIRENVKNPQPKVPSSSLEFQFMLDDAWSKKSGQQWRDKYSGLFPWSTHAPVIKKIMPGGALPFYRKRRQDQSFEEGGTIKYKELDQQIAKLRKENYDLLEELSKKEKPQINEKNLLESNVDVLEVKEFFIKGDAAEKVNWEEYGIRIDILKGTLLPNETAKGVLKPLVGGNFTFPDNIIVVSAVYDITVSQPLLQSLRIDIEHCVDITNEEQMTNLRFAFAPAVESPDLPYQFTIIEGEFAVGSRYGTIYRNQFSKFCIISYGVDNPFTSSEGGDTPTSNETTDAGFNEREEEKLPVEMLLSFPAENLAVAGENGSVQLKNTKPIFTTEKNHDERESPQRERQLYLSSKLSASVNRMRYFGVILYQWKNEKAIFSCARDLSVLSKHFECKYKNTELDLLDIHFSFAQNQSSITLCFPNKDSDKTDGWVCEFFTNPPILLREDIDNFGIKKNSIPSTCQIILYPDDYSNAVSRLHKTVTVEGTREPTSFVLVARKDKFMQLLPKSQTTPQQASVSSFPKAAEPHPTPSVNPLNIFQSKFLNLCTIIDNDVIKVSASCFGKSAITLTTHSNVFTMGKNNFEKANQLLMDIINQLKSKNHDQQHHYLKDQVFEAFLEVGNDGLTEIVEQMKLELQY